MPKEFFVLFKRIKELKIGKSLYEYDLHVTDGLPYSLYFADISDYANESVPLHWHREFEIVVVTKGKIKAFVDDIEIIIEKGEGAFFNAEMFHGYTQTEGMDAQFLTAVFAPSFITGSESENPFFTKYILPIINNGELRFIKFSPSVSWHAECLEYAEKLFAMDEAQSPYYDFSARDYLTKIICLIHANNRSYHNPELCGMNFSITKMTDYIKNNYTDDISVCDIAKSANISRRDCFRKFRESMGVTPFDYLDSVRIKAASLLLLETDKTITEICYETGFSSGSYFSTKFKKAMGCSPAEFRKNNAKK